MAKMLTGKYLKCHKNIQYCILTKNLCHRAEEAAARQQFICATAFAWLSKLSSQEVVERSTQEVTLIRSIKHNMPRDEYAAKHGAPLTREKTEKVLIKIQRSWIQIQKHSRKHSRKSQQFSRQTEVTWNYACIQMSRDGEVVHIIEEYICKTDSLVQTWSKLCHYHAFIVLVM